MEELRKVVIKIQENIIKLATADEEMRGVIKCNSGNLENLKKFTLDINERVRLLEENVKSKNIDIDKLIVEHVEKVKDELANLDDKIDSFEDNLAEEFEKIDKNISNSTKKQSEERRKLEELINENDKKMMEVEANLLHQEEIIKKEQKVFNCDECSESFTIKGDRRKHIEEHHPKQFSCEHFNSKFEKSWMYE